jgi:histidinol phosphatase-like PHP family hydrolase
MARCGFLLGSMHRLPSLSTPQPDPRLVIREFMAMHEHFLASGIKVLAHPFRVLGNLPFESDKEMLADLVALLKKNNVAAELNFHHAGIPEEFATMCLEAGVKFSLGSDAHGFWELGHFAPHLELLHKCGFNGNIADILIDPRQ